MKNFLNVLYRRILYKIPLKLLLVLLAIFGLLFACTKADYVSSLIDYVDSQSITITPGQVVSVVHLTNSSNYGTYCLKLNSLSDGLLLGTWDSLSPGSDPGMYIKIRPSWVGGYACSYVDLPYLYLRNDSSSNISISYDLFRLNSLLLTEVPVYTISQCQSEYNLIPISEVDSSYCQSNNLCPSGGTPSDCPNIGVSNLFINDIFHPGAFNIIMNIPEEIDWDYAYTNSGNNMNIDIVGYNVDYEKMQDIIDTQNYKPNSDELSSIISQIIPLFVPGLCIILLLYFIFRFIKKIF